MDFESVERKIIETLKAQVSALRTVEGYAGQLEAELEKLPVRFPAAFVVYSGSQYSWVDGPSHAERAEFGVLVCTKNVRSAADGRVEAYALVRDALGALVNEDFGLPMERLRPVSTTLVFTNALMSVYEIVFQTGFDTEFAW